MASRLSFGLWDSLPDDELMRAAASGRLNTREDIAKQAERMVHVLNAPSPAATASISIGRSIAETAVKQLGR